MAMAASNESGVNNGGIVASMAAQYQYRHGGISISIRRKPETGEMAIISWRQWRRQRIMA
jgi:hypothetical protein